MKNRHEGWQFISKYTEIINHLFLKWVPTGNWAHSSWKTAKAHNFQAQENPEGVELSAIHGEGAKHKEPSVIPNRVNLKLLRKLSKQLATQQWDFIHWLCNLISKNPHAPHGHIFLPAYFSHLHKRVYILIYEKRICNTVTLS